MELDKNCVREKLVMMWVDYFEEIETTLMALIFYRCFFELFKDLMLVIGIRFEKNMSCYIVLITYNKIIHMQKQNFLQFLQYGNFNR